MCQCYSINPQIASLKREFAYQRLTNCPPRQHHPPWVEVGLPNRPGLFQVDEGRWIHEVRLFEDVVDVVPNLESESLFQHDVLLQRCLGPVQSRTINRVAAESPAVNDAGLANALTFHIGLVAFVLKRSPMVQFWTMS